MSQDAGQEKQEFDGLSQESYRETPYEDSAWEIVGEFDGEQEFAPLEFQVLTSEQIVTDPMFADYGGLPQSDSVRRWHLPGELAYKAPHAEAKAEEEVVDTSIRIEPEELERRLAEAEARGRQSGYEEAVAQNLERLKMLEERFAVVLEDISKQREQDFTVLEVQAVELAMAVARKIVAHAVEINPEYIIEIVREALTHAGGAKVRKVRVSPEDMEFINVIGLEKRMREYDGSWQFEKDETIKSGCIVETSAGEIEYDLDRAWERVRDNVVKVIR